MTMTTATLATIPTSSAGIGHGVNIGHGYVKYALIGPDGSERTVKTSAFGYFKFDDVESGSSYTLTVSSKQYSFAVPSRVVSVGDEITDLDFTAQQ